MNKLIKNILFTVLVVPFITVRFAFAADIFLTADTQKYVVKEEFVVDVYLNTQGESINAVGVKLFYPQNLLHVKEIRDGGSIVKLWVQRPSVTQIGIINFSGVTPGGYQGDSGLLFSVVFEAKALGQGKIESKEPQALKNDGKGTAVSVTTSTMEFSIMENTTGEAPKIESIDDNILPEPFTPELSRVEELYDGKWFVAFVAEDKDSGIDHYEITEDGQNWVTALSPYILLDQTFKNNISVKAVDKAGNERIVPVASKKSSVQYENYYIWVIIIALLVLLGCYSLWRKFRNQK